MKKTIKIILAVVGILIVALVILYILVMRGVVPVDIPYDRTRYTGYVQIEPLSLSEIKIRLENNGCHPIGYRPHDYQGETESLCRFKEVTVRFDNQNGIEIYPGAEGSWGPTSFYLTEKKLWASKDITGSPNLDKFAREVRQDVQDIGEIVQIRENSWTLTETIYPGAVTY